MQRDVSDRSAEQSPKRAENERNSAPADLQKRKFLTAITSLLGGVGILAAFFPFLSAWSPSKRAKALGGPVKVSLEGMAPGERKTIEWRGKPVWIIRRTPEMLASLNKDEDKLRDPFSKEPQQPAFAENIYRSSNDEFLVLIGVCTHLGCSPTYRPEVGQLGKSWPGGFFCPCHGSSFDMAGRVFKGVPAPLNLQVPPYYFLSEKEMLIGGESSA